MIRDSRILLCHNIDCMCIYYLIVFIDCYEILWHCREDYDEFSRQNYAGVLERQMTPEFGSPPGLMSGHMSPHQHRNSPAFRDSPHSHRGYRPHQDSPLVYSPAHQEASQTLDRPSSRRREDIQESTRRYSSSSSHQEDNHYGSSPAERHYGSSPNYGHMEQKYGDPNIYHHNQELGMTEGLICVVKHYFWIVKAYAACSLIHSQLHVKKNHQTFTRPRL